MKKIFVMCFVVGLFFSGPAFASLSEQLEMAENLNISAVKSMQVNTSGANYYLDLVLQMRNTNDRDIKLSDTNFAIKLGSQTYSPILIGNTTRTEFTLPAISSESSPSTDVPLRIKLGSNQGEVLKTLKWVMNIIGDPSNSPKVLMSGDASAAIQTKKGGWIRSAERLPIEDMPYYPKVQKELLLE